MNSLKRESDRTFAEVPRVFCDFCQQRLSALQSVCMMIFIYGEDTYRVQEKVKQMKDAFKEKFDPTGMNLAVFPSLQASKIEPKDVLQAACSYPFLGSKRMVVVGGLFEQVKKQEEQVWIKGFKRLPESTIAVFWEVGSAPAIEKKKMFTELSAQSDIHKYSFDQLKGAALKTWVAERIKARKGTIDPTALTELVIRVGSNLWQLSQEIEKLIAFAQEKVVTKIMVEQLVQSSFESRIFDLMDACSKKQKTRAVQLLKEERASGSDDHYLLTMLGRQVRILISARAYLDAFPKVTKQEMAGALSVHPFVAQKAIEQARLFSLDDLKSVHDQLFETDKKLKTGYINAGLATDLIVDRLIRA